MHESLSKIGGSIKGHVKITDLDSNTVFYERKNVICNGVAYLFARLLTNNTDPVAGIWGLAIGAGGTSTNGWSSNQQPDPTALQIAMVREIKRKQLAQVRYLDADGNPTTTLTTTVDFQTILNATTDNITIPIREMGLIGGGTTLASNDSPTNMLTAPYFDPANPTANSVTLVNYITCPSFLLPAGVNMGISWSLAMGL